MDNKVIAISGMPGSGKTTVSKRIIEEYDNIVYFDFGFLFRPVTYYLTNVLNLTDEDIKCLKENNALKDIIKIDYKIQNNEINISVNGNFYSYEELNNKKMDKQTVIIGSLIGDGMNDTLKSIIDDIKKEHNILLNARRPVETYPNLDKHIFLECSFEKRCQRKMLMNNDSWQTTEKELQNRDKKEYESGFWNKYDFTKVINTSNLTEKETFKEVKNCIDNDYTNLNNLTLILGSYKCNKNCPYCIAKNNAKFVDYDDRLEELPFIFDELLRSNIRFKRFVLSGNGEPSLYSYEELELIKRALVEYKDLFKICRIHSSGNIFFNEDKFSLFNDSELPVEFEVLRVNFDSDIDRKVLGYKQDYLSSELFERARNVKCDIALTDYLGTNDLNSELQEFLDAHDSIKTIRLKKLLAGDHINSMQSLWVQEHSLNDSQIEKIIGGLGLIKMNHCYISPDGKIVYKASGNYGFDKVINNGSIQDYNCNHLTIKKLVRK